MRASTGGLGVEWMCGLGVTASAYNCVFRWVRVCSGGRECVQVGESVLRWERVCSGG